LFLEKASVIALASSIVVASYRFKVLTFRYDPAREAALSGVKPEVPLQYLDFHVGKVGVVQSR
jgi:hypothetical protein